LSTASARRGGRIGGALARQVNFLGNHPKNHPLFPLPITLGVITYNQFFYILYISPIMKPIKNKGGFCIEKVFFFHPFCPDVGHGFTGLRRRRRQRGARGTAWSIPVLKSNEL